MKNIDFNLFPNGKTRAVTFSYDDGTKEDYKMTEIFDRYGAKCTYNLNSARISDGHHIDKEFVKEISTRHEIASHSVTHPFLERLPRDLMMREIIDDKCALEDIIGKPVIGGAYPYGTYDSAVVEALKSAGIKYYRTTKATNNFMLPENFLTLHPTCHHRDSLAIAERFINTSPWTRLPMFYVWGHSFEFPRDNNWEILDELFAILGSTDTIYYATNGELYDYYTAIHALRITADGSCIVNPTATTVYATIDGKPQAIIPGTNRF